MLTETDRQIAREFQRRLAAIVPLLDLRVFGSRARGDTAPDSDLDVFIENDYPNCSRWTAKSGGYGLDLAVQAERNGTFDFFHAP